MGQDVFISYSSRDKPTADAVCAGLESSGVRCWVAPRDILPGMSWSAALIEAIESSRLMVVILSTSSNTSPQVGREVERAVSRGLPILPFRIEDVMLSKSMEYYLSTPHWLDAITPPLERHIRELVRTVALLLDRTDIVSEEVQEAAEQVIPPFEEQTPDDWSKPKGRVGRFLHSLLEDR